MNLIKQLTRRTTSSDLTEIAVALALLCYGKYISSLSGTVYLSGAAYALLGASFFYVSSSTRDFKATSSATRTRVLLVILASTAMSAGLTRRLDHTAKVYKTSQLLDTTSKLLDTCRPAARLIGPEESTMYENAVYNDPGASLRCEPASCDCLDGVARARGDRKCQLLRTVEPPFNVSRAGTYIAHYHFECGLQGKGPGRFFTPPVSRVLRVRQRPSLALRRVGEQYRSVEVQFSGLVCASAPDGDAESSLSASACPTLTSASFQISLIDAKGTQSSSYIAISRVKVIPQRNDTSSSDLSGNVFRLHLPTIKIGNGSLSILPAASKCYDALPPYSPCDHSPAIVPLAGGPSTTIALSQRISSELLVVSLAFSEAVGERSAEETRPLCRESLVFYVVSSPRPTFWSRTLTRTPVRIREIHPEDETTYMVSLELSAAMFRAGDRLVAKINEPSRSRNGRALVALAWPRLEVEASTWEFALALGQCCGEEANSYPIVEHAELCDSRDSFQATLDPCPTVAKAIPELLRQAATTVRKSSVPLKLNGPPVITLYQQQEFTDPGVIDQDDQVAVYFDRPKDIPGSYIQTYSIGPDEALDTVTRVIRVRDGPPKPFILGWFPDVDAGGMIVLLRFSHTVANVSAEGVTVSFGAGPVGIVNMTHEPAIDAWRLHLARGPTDEEAPVLQLVFSELACADPMPHGLCSPTLLALAMDQPLAVTVIEVAWQRGSVRVHLMPLVTVRGDGLDPSLFHAKWTSLSEVDGASVSRVETLPDQGMMVVVEFGSDRRTLEERQDLNGRQLLLCPQGSDLIDPTSRRILTDCLTIPRNLHSLIFCQKIRSNASMLQMRTSNNHFAVLLVRRTGL